MSKSANAFGPRRRLLRTLVATGLWPGLVLPARAQGLGLAKILLGAPAGGAGDLMARRLAEKLRGGYAGTVIVENKPGAGGQLAVAALKDAADDGSVLLLTPSSLLSIYPFTYKTLPYKPETDLAPVCLAAYATMALAVGPGVPASVQSFKDFLAWARANPAQASYGSPAAGSIPHLLMAAVAQASGVALTHVAYRGSTNALQDLRGGTLPALSAPVGAFLPHLKSGQLRLLAVSGDKRNAALPEVPTYRELGHALTAREWYGFFLPGRASKDTVARAAAALQAALRLPDVAEALAQFGLEAASSTPAELAALIRADSDEWRTLIRKLGFTADS
ncbi:MAG: twin-arginine translocation pathway signal protein [Burkholderiales bacterium]|nr:twin-arginine translocation pathway signal protein [Burkholderiales bacterium]